MMNFSIAAGSFAQAVGLVKGCVPAKSTIPVLSRVLIAARNGAINVRATNLDIEAEANSQADIAEEGLCAVQAEILHGVVKRFGKNDTVTIVADAINARVTCGKSHYMLRVMPVDEFPVFTEFEVTDDSRKFEIHAQSMVKLIETTIYAVELSGNSRQFLQGIYLSQQNDKLVAVASDGRRLAECSAPLPGGADGMPDVIIPILAALEIQKIISGYDGDITIHASPQRMRIDAGDASLTTRLIDGKYLDYQQFVPPMDKAAITVRPSMLCNAIDRAMMVYSGTDIKAPAAQLVSNGDGINLLTGIPGHDEAVESVDATVHKSSINIRVNAQFLAQMLKLWPDVDVDVQDSVSAGGPILFQSKEVPNVRHVIMPQLR